MNRVPEQKPFQELYEGFVILPAMIRYWCCFSLSNMYPAVKHPIMDPIELIINMNEICPTVTPSRSFKSRRVGPMTPSVAPRTKANVSDRMK